MIYNYIREKYQAQQSGLLRLKLLATLPKRLQLLQFLSLCLCFVCCFTYSVAHDHSSTQQPQHYQAENAKSLKFKDASGKEVSLADFGGNPTILVFWATYCRPCLEELHSLDSFAPSLAGRVNIVAVVLDDNPDDAKGIFHKLGITNLRVYYDHSSEMAKTFGVTAVPIVFTLDEKSKIIGESISGARSWLSESMQNMVENRFKMRIK